MMLGQLKLDVNLYVWARTAHSRRTLKQARLLTYPTLRVRRDALYPKQAAASEGPQADLLGYVESLSDAITPLAGCFSILLEARLTA
jgi:hypothetical protein